jgi:hypothetical protein
MAAALPLAAQPKLLINAKLDTQSAASGLEPAFTKLVQAQPQPAWIGYSVPSVRTYNLGCEYVSRDGGPGAGVIHLEPPDHAVILFRVVNNAVERIRSVSPDCEIDAGDVPFHWLNDVQPAQSVTLLATFVAQWGTGGTPPASSAVSAIAMHSDPAADAALDRFLATTQPEAVRLRTVSIMGSMRGHRGFETLKNLIANDPNERVRERAVSALASSKDPEAVDLLIATARNDRSARLRAQAVGELGRKNGPNVVSTITNAIENDPDTQVKRRAVNALQSMPDGAGIPLLIEVVKTTKSPEVRRQAMNALENARDPRAISFFEQVLK